MNCPYCNAPVKAGAKFCTECGATLNIAAVQQQQQTRQLATNSGMAFGAAAREIRRNTVVSEGELISARAYNGILLGVLLWGLAINVLLCFTVGSVYDYIHPVAFGIGYFVLALIGIVMAAKSDNPWISFLGYNMVVVPFGLVISTLVDAYGGPYTDVVADAFLYTLIITVGMTGAALAFPNFFSKLGGALLGCLFGLLLCEIVLLILGRYQMVTDWIAAGLFSLYIGYDVWRSQQFPKTVDNAVDCALDIYLDLANLFIRLLSILAKRDD